MRQKNAQKTIKMKRFEYKRDKEKNKEQKQKEKKTKHYLNVECTIQTKNFRCKKQILLLMILMIKCRYC
jgi:hypothetical protein